MTKTSKTSGFAALANFNAKPVDLEAPTDVDTQGEDLGDLNDAKETIAKVTDITRDGDKLIVHTTTQEPVEDEREGEDTSGLNEETEDDVEETVQVEDEEEAVPSLNDRDVSTWTTQELEEYITGFTNETVYHSTVLKAITEHRIRVDSLAAAWTLDECKEFLLAGITPPKTTKGAWLKDETRKYRREHEWSTSELESWALGEIQPEGVTLAAGLAVELKNRLNLVVPSADVDAIITCYKHTTGQTVKPLVLDKVKPAESKPVTEAQIESVKNQIKYEGLSTMNQSYIESSLATFESVMKVGKAILPRTGGDAQKLLSEVINYAIRLPDPAASRSAMTLLLNYFKERRGDGQLFEDTYAFRNIEDMRVPVKDQESHAALLTLFLVYADPLVELRAQTDVPSLIAGVPSQYQSRVIEFFGKL